MKIIIPMAGMGKRMRPHTLTVPKPLIPIAGKPMVQRIVEDMAKICHENISDVGFVISELFGKQAEEHLIGVAESLGAKGHIFYQKEPLGTAHAILCAAPLLDDKVLIAFSDTLFIPDPDSQVDTEKDGIIWVQKVEDPKPFGVVKLDKEGTITDFVEKPQEFVSDLAIIGIYYFKDGKYLKSEMQYLIDNDLKDRGEFQLTDAMENMKKKGTKFVTSQVKEWLDCGNKDATVYTNGRILETYYQNGNSVNEAVLDKDSEIIPPCVIGKNVKLIKSKVGPNVSIGEGSVIENSVISNCIIQSNTTVQDSKLSNSLLGNHVVFKGKSENASIGDYSTIQE